MMLLVLPSFGLPQELTSFSQFFSGLTIGVVLLIKFYGKKSEITTSAHKTIGIPLIIVTVFAVFLIPIGFLLNNIFTAYPIDERLSDVIPTIRIAVQRFLAGETVYKEVKFDAGWTLVHVGYLPMQWLPFSIAEMLKLDYRMIAFFIWAIASITLIYRTAKSDKWHGIVIASLSLVMIFLVSKFQSALLGTTVELMVAGYYILFIIGQNQKSPVLKGLGIVICLLSRFSLVLWLPLWIITEWFSGERKHAIIAAVTIFFAVLIIYVIPFMSQDWGMFFRVFKNYDKAAMGEWQHLNASGKPYHLYAGNGFAYLYYEKLAHLDLMQRIKALKMTHLILSLLSVITCAVFYYFKNSKYQYYQIFLLASFKIYLTFFLQFIQVPYTYILMVGCFVSLAIIAEQSRYKFINN
jgi:hypothetical protein